MSARQSSAVDQALRLVQEGITPYRAAKMIGIALSTIYRARKRAILKEAETTLPKSTL